MPNQICLFFNFAIKNHVQLFIVTAFTLYTHFVSTDESYCVQFVVWPHSLDLLLFPDN